MMDGVKYLDILTMVSCVAAFLFIVLLGRKDRFVAAVKLLALSISGLMFLYGFCLFIEWAGFSSRFESLEDLLGAILPMVWAFFLYALLRNIHENDLKQSREKFRALTESTSDWIWEADEDGILTYSSPQVEQVLGYGPAEVVGRHLYDFLSGRELEMVRKRYERAVIGGEPVLQLEVMAANKGGVVRYLETSAIPFFDADMNVRGFRGITRDITMRKKAELAMYMSEQRFRAIADYTHDWEIWVSPAGTPLWTNPAVERVTGYSAKECGAMSDYPRELIVEEDRERFDELFKAGLGGIPGENKQLRIRRKDGTVRWVTGAWQPIYDHKGTCQGFRASFEDFTARKVAEQRMEHKQEVLSTLMANLPGMAYRCRAGDDFIIEFVSGGCFELTGYSAAMVAKQPREAYERFIVEEDVERVRRELREALGGREVFGSEYRIRTADGEVKWVLERAKVFYEGGAAVLMEGFVMDVGDGHGRGRG